METGHLCGEFTDSPHKGQWRGAFMFSLICAWINRWVNNSEAGDLRRYRVHYDAIVMTTLDTTLVIVTKLHGRPINILFTEKPSVWRIRLAEVQ